LRAGEFRGSGSIVRKHCHSEPLDDSARPATTRSAGSEHVLNGERFLLAVLCDAIAGIELFQGAAPFWRDDHRSPGDVITGWQMSASEAS
jgi:hypothetical protein